MLFYKDAERSWQVRITRWYIRDLVNWLSSKILSFSDTFSCSLSSWMTGTIFILWDTTVPQIPRINWDRGVWYSAGSICEPKETLQHPLTMITVHNAWEFSNRLCSSRRDGCSSGRTRVRRTDDEAFQRLGDISLFNGPKRSTNSLSPLFLMGCEVDVG